MKRILLLKPITNSKIRNNYNITQNPGDESYKKSRAI